MKKLFKMLIILSLIYLVIQMGFKYFGFGHNINYQIEKDGLIFNIEEKYTANRKREINNYYFNIKVDDSLFSFQTYENFNYSDMVVKDIKYYKDEKYECLLPIFLKDKIIFDFLCKYNNEITYYYNLVGQNEDLDNFVNNINEKKYDIKNWIDDKNEPIISPPITVYQKNILSNHIVGVNNYRGIFTINNLNLKKVVNIELFQKDIYERKISAIVGKYYVTADYEQPFEFDRFYIVDLTSNKPKTVNNPRKISFDSYIQGSINNLLFLFDRENKRQYQINPKTNKIVEVGNEDMGIRVYDNGNWLKIEANEAVENEILFKDNQETTSDEVYARIDKIGNVLSGYYYYYQKKGKEYKVYRVNIQNPDFKIYLFSTKQIDDIQYVRDYIYFSEDNEVKYYHDKTGVKTLFKNDEFEFNKSLFYSVFLQQ